MAHARRKFDELIKENQSPVAAQAVQRIAWLYRIEREAKELPADERLAMSLAQSAKTHGHDPWAYLKDVLTRLPNHLNSRIDELLPHRWQPAG